jgi:hypothetical protein
LLDAEIFRYKVIGKDTTLKNVIVTIDSCGTRKLVQQYYASEYTRKDYTPPTETPVIKAKKDIVAAENNTPINKRDLGKSEIAGLTYKVEIAAVDKEEEFKLEHLKKYGKIESKKYPDGKIRYTFGPFKTLAEAEDFRKGLMEKEPEIAKSIVTVFFFGVRKTLEEYANPCNPSASTDFSAFVGKDLNDKEVYNRLIDQAGNMCAEVNIKI